MKNFVFIALSLLLICGNSDAGSNAGAVSSLDLVGVGAGVAGNGRDDRVVQGTVTERGTKITVEVFASGVTTALSGADATFNIDTSLLKVSSVTAPSVFPLVLPHTDTTATVGAFAPGLPPNGLIMTVVFETVVDVTGREFSIGLRELNIAVSPTDSDILRTGRITFNGSSLQIAVDIQRGTGDGQLSTVHTISASPGENVIIEVFASGITNSLGFEAFFQVSNPSAIASATGSNQGGPYTLPLQSTITSGGSVNLTVGGFAAVNIPSGTPKFIGSLTLGISQTASPFTVTLISASPNSDGEVTQNIVMSVNISTNSNAGAVSSLDLVGVGAGMVGNGRDDRVVQGTVTGRGTRITVEVFASGVTTALSGANATFNIDTSLLKVSSVTAPSVFPLVLPHTDTTATVGAFAPGLPPNGLIMTVVFETMYDVTGRAFSIGLRELNIAVSPTDANILRTGSIAFNSQPADLIPPVIGVPVVEISGGATMIRAQVTDNVGLREVSLLYRIGGQTTYAKTSMESIGNNNYRATIPASAITPRGTEYLVQAIDLSGNLRTIYANEQTQRPFFLQSDVTNVSAQQYTGGSSQTAYRMVSVPLYVDNNMGNLLSQLLGEYKRDIWRLYRFNPASQLFEEYPGTMNLVPGQVFWLISTRNVTLTIPSGKTVDTTQDFEISLTAGWNNIGIPFNYPVNWPATPNVSGPFTYEGGWQGPQQISRLEPWKGYAVRANVNTTIRIPRNQAVGTKMAVSQPLSQRLRAGEWVMTIEAKAGQAIDNINQVGQLYAAQVEWDEWALPEPPPVGSYVSVVFPRPEWILNPGDYTSDFRPVQAGGVFWDFEVRSNIQGETVGLTFLDIETIPPNHRVLLLDRASLREVDVGEAQFYHFKMGQEQVRSFRLFVGEELEVNRLVEETHASYQTSRLLSNIPNPFNSQTIIPYQIAKFSDVRLEIFNLQGQVVRTLVQESQNPGVYRVLWDAYDDTGREVASGLYLSRLSVPEGQFVNKMLLLK